MIFLCPGSDFIFSLFINKNISKLKLFLFGETRYSLLSIYDINISNISFQPHGVFVVVILNLNFKLFGSFLNL